MTGWHPLDHETPSRLPFRPRMVEPAGHSVRVNNLPWVRRERADANIRRAIGDLRALWMEDPEWGEQYRALADAFQAAVGLLDAIEDLDSRKPTPIRRRYTL